MDLFVTFMNTEAARPLIPIVGTLVFLVFFSLLSGVVPLIVLILLYVLIFRRKIGNLWMVEILRLYVLSLLLTFYVGGMYFDGPGGMVLMITMVCAFVAIPVWVITEIVEIGKWQKRRDERNKAKKNRK